MPIYVATDATLGEVTPQRGKGALGHDGYRISASGTPDSEPGWGLTEHYVPSGVSNRKR
jgi:hypothetical protein